jgi:beta-phosphoglucomutase-like phosphatase (HAD superfamily)
MSVKLETSGFVFDLDGMLVETQLEHHAKVESEILKKYGVQIYPEEISEKYAGISTKQVFRTIAPHLDPETLAREKWVAMYAHANTEDLREVPGMMELIRVLHAKQIPISVASASPLRWIRMCLEKKVRPTQKRYGSYFGKRFVSAEHCENPKPYPDVFLKGKEVALNGYHGKPIEQWFAIGDGESDVKAGLAAGMHVLYFSKNNTTYDNHEKVTRFAVSTDLIAHILLLGHLN